MNKQELKEHPIIFSDEMVRAILEGEKVQTRRIITPNNSIVGEGKVDWNDFCWDGTEIYKNTCPHGHTMILKAPLPFPDGIKLHVPYNYSEECTVYRIYPKWSKGDRLWVRENWSPWADELSQEAAKGMDKPCLYRADYKKGCPPAVIGGDDHWHSPRFMFREYSRITLEIIDIRAEKLQDITGGDAIKEGCGDIGIVPLHTAMLVTGTSNVEDCHKELAKSLFIMRWDNINAKRGHGWDKNEWVWVITFKAVGK